MPPPIESLIVNCKREEPFSPGCIDKSLK
ncbi:hypothetical protein MPC4_160023 [Methylocella tundrae]|uniref:Uncharacterized protein n=1 Tax=Methylocella tundrae TaxID=227605 RepID=A0A8B6M4U1_METTU|nr:hypothetical protein MPC4_160023 [Methylocella tundrae]